MPCVQALGGRLAKCRSHHTSYRFVIHHSECSFGHSEKHTCSDPIKEDQQITCTAPHQYLRHWRLLKYLPKYSGTGSPPLCGPYFDHSRPDFILLSMSKDALCYVWNGNHSAQCEASRIGCTRFAYLLQTFNKKEQEDIDFAVQDGIDIVKTILAQGMEKALSGVRSGAGVA